MSMGHEASQPGTNAEVLAIGDGAGGLSRGQRLICQRVINVFETGSTEGDYGAIATYHDGPGGIRQITYGRSQTTEYGNLRELLDMYADAGGAFSEALRSYIGKIARLPQSVLVDDETFKRLLRRAGREDPVMRRTQDEFFDRRYFEPALRWWRDNGFVRALSALVIYDSFIHSGSIRESLRARFPERPPADGGDERTWIRQYVDVRHEWLKHHDNAAVRASAYRTRDLAREIAAGNWDLDDLPLMANGVPVDASDPPQRYEGNGEELAGAQAAAERSDEPILQGLAQERGLAAAMDRLIALRNERYPESRPRYWAIANFDLHSRERRFFVLDVVARQSTAYLCAHGIGSEGPSDDGMADVFSNEPGSHATSLGIYRCAETYEGRNGYSLRLDGLEETNSRARDRYVVVHGANYVSDEFVDNHGRVGRSQGCPALDHQYARTVIDQLKHGSLLIHCKGP